MVQKSNRNRFQSKKQFRVALIVWFVLSISVSFFVSKVQNPFEFWKVRNQLYATPLIDDLKVFNEAQNGDTLDIIGNLIHRSERTNSAPILSYLTIQTPSTAGNMPWAWTNIDRERNHVAIELKTGGLLNVGFLNEGRIRFDVHHPLSDYIDLPPGSCSDENLSFISTKSSYEYCSEHRLMGNETVYLRGIKENNSLQNAKIVSFKTHKRSEIFWAQHSIFDFVPIIVIVFLFLFLGPVLLSLKPANDNKTLN